MATQLYNQTGQSEQSLEKYDDHNQFLRRAIQWDSGIIALLAVDILIFAGPIAAFMGIANPTILQIAGVIGLLYDGGRFLWSRMGEAVDPRLAQLSLYGNAIWALVSIPVLAFEWLPLSNGGWWVMAILADFAALFAILQWYGLRQTK